MKYCISWLIALLLLSAQASLVEAAWPTQGELVAGGPGQQFSPAVCRDEAGGVLVSWLVLVSDTSADLHLQRFALDGSIALGWPASGVNLGHAYVEYANPDPRLVEQQIASDDAGGAFVLWHAGDRYNDVPDHLLHINAAAQVASGWPASGIALPTASTFESGATLLSDGTGGVFVAWSDLQDGDLHVRVQHLRGDGVPFAGWPASGVRVKDGFYAQYDPALALDGEGGVWIGWADSNYPSPGLAVKSSSLVRVLHHVTSAAMVDPALPPAGIQVGGFQPDEVPFGLASDSAGGVYMVWNGANATQSQYGLFAQRFVPGGTVAGGWPGQGLLLSSSALLFDPTSTLADATGGIIAAWCAYESAPQRLAVRALRVKSNATLAPGWDPSGVRLGFAADVPRFVPDGSGGANVVWADSAQVSGETDLFAQHIAPDGSPATFPGDNRLAVCTASGVQETYRMASDGSGGAYVAWVDQRADTGDVYLKRVSLGDLTASVEDGVLPAAIRLSRPVPNPSSGRIQIAFSVEREGALDAEVLDLSGRIRRRFAPELRASTGAQVITWDGRDDSGRPVAPGVYQLIVRSGRNVASVRIVRLH